MNDVTRPLARLALGMAALAPLLLAGLVIDPRVVTGAPVWLEPLKFTLSVAIYSGTLALVLRHVDVWPGRLRVASRVVAWGLWVEMAIIYLQAARGTTSHFNEATPVDTVLFRVMGTVIVTVTLASAAIAAASYAGLVALLFWEALRGASIVAPGAQSLLALLVWLAVSAAAVTATLAGTRRSLAGSGAVPGRSARGEAA